MEAKQTEQARKALSIQQPSHYYHTDVPLKALQGFLDSVFKLANIPLVCPYHTCLSRRAKEVEVSFKTKTRGEIQYLAIDSTGLKVYGKGEWEVKSMVLMGSAESGVSCI